MPEGHTLHRLAREQQELVGERLSVTSPQGRFADGAAALDGRRLAGIEAKGKHLFHHFDGDAHLHVHLGLAGKFFRNAAPLPQTRARLEAPRLGVDWQLVAPIVCEVVDGDRLEMLLGRLGPDPLRDDADRDQALIRLRKSGRTIAEILLDQSVIAGVGNVFRAEALFACGIHPRRPGTSLSEDEAACLWDTLVPMMARAVDEGRIMTVPGSSGLAESEGRFVYKQEACRRCGAPIETETLGGRTSYACPACQIRPAVTSGRRGSR